MVPWRAAPLVVDMRKTALNLSPSNSPPNKVARTSYDIASVPFARLRGYPGKTYRSCEIVQLICDAMSILESRYGHFTTHRRAVQRNKVEAVLMSGGVAGTSAYLNVDVEDDFGLFQHASMAGSRLNFPEPGIYCLNCKTRNPQSQRRDAKSGCFVCEECGAEGNRKFEDGNYNETHNADGKITARADVPLVTNNRFSTLLNETHNRSVVSESTVKKNHIGSAVKVVDQAMRSSASKRDGYQSKFAQLVEITGDILTKLGVKDGAVVTRINTMAFVVFSRAYEHQCVCDRRTCQKDIIQKPIAVIAREVLEYSMNQMLSSKEGVEGLSKQKIMAFYKKVQESLEFRNKDNATQHQSCRAIIDSLVTQDHNQACSATRETSPHTRREGKQTMNYTETCTDVGVRQAETQSSPLVQMRDAIMDVSQSCSFPSEVQQAALVALQEPSFVKSITQVPVVSAKQSKQASAYTILFSIAKRMNKPCDTSCHSFGLNVGNFSSAVDRILSILPERAIHNYHQDDDELY